MNLKHVWTVFKKEVKDIVRDKKTLFMSIVIPMVLIPVMNMLVGGGVEKLQKDISENITMALSQESNTPEIKKLIESQMIADHPNIKLKEVADPDKALQEEEIRLIMEIEPGYLQKLEEKKPFEIKLTYDKSKAKSDGSVSIVQSAIEEFNQKVIIERIEALGESADMLQPATIVENNIADETQTSTSMLAMFLPFILVILVAVGGIPAATDLVAGEKERNTFEPLLTTRPGRSSILAGKYLTVTLFSFITVIATVIGIMIGYRINPSSLSMGSGQEITGFAVDPLAFALAILVSITLGMMFAGIQIALSTYAKSFKEAQTYLSFLMIAAMIPAYATMFTQPSDIPVYSFLVPVLNAISAFKIVLGGTINYTYLALAFVSSIVYVVIATAIATYMFKNEKYLFRS